MPNISAEKRLQQLAHGRIDEREDKFIENLIAGIEPYKAGIKAGYAEVTARNLQYKKFNNARFLAKFAMHFKGKAATSLLPKMQALVERQLKHAETASKAIDKQTSKARKSKDHEKVVELQERAVKIIAKTDGAQERVAKMAGVIRPDGVQQLPPIIAIHEVQNLLLQVSQDNLKNGKDNEL